MSLAGAISKVAEATPTGPAAHRVSVAPMMDRTDRHFRWLMRRISRRTLLYTEMVTAHALLHGDRLRLLGYDPSEHPIALQLGGDGPEELAECAKMAEDAGYDEVNLNVGCPSDRVQRGSFGACLMLDPDRVARAVAAMAAAVNIPVTVKHRIGVDERDQYEDMLAFVDRVSREGAARFSVHARKAWLSGLSPKENRNIPPLRPDEIWRLKQERPDLLIEINGGIRDLHTVAEHLKKVDAVMLGRAAWDEPYLFAEVDQRFYAADSPPPKRRTLVEAYVDYLGPRLREQPARRVLMLRPLLNLFAGEWGAKAWKRELEAALRSASPESLPEKILDIETKLAQRREEWARQRSESSRSRATTRTSA